MRKPKPPTGPREEDGQLQKALAILISSTRRRNRPLPLTEIARWLEVAVAMLGSYSTVADRIGLSPKMLRQFSSVRRLTRPVQRLFESRRLESVDAATHLAMLPSSDQEVMAEALASGEIDTSDIRAVVQLRKIGPPEPLHSLLKRVRESKTTREYVAEFVVRGARTGASILNSFKKYIPSNDVIRLELNGSLGRIVLTSNGRQALNRCAQAFGVPLKRVIPIILEGRNR
jgi:DNA-binding transcriptional regulator YdaS (Cro superfamily)